MARSRNIKPGFFKNEELAECDPLARLLFAGLWTLADREGRMEYRPKRIKAEILPYDDCNIVDLINQLSRYGFITLYEVDRITYIDIPTFTQHQNPHKNEADSVIPSIDSEGAVIVGVQYNSGASTVQVPELHASTPADSFNPITDSLKPKKQRKKREQPDKIQFAEFVRMTEQENKKLVEQYGEFAANRMITILDNYKGSHGKKYDSDYRAILNWVVKRYNEETKSGGSKFIDDDREWGY